MKTRTRGCLLALTVAIAPVVTACSSNAACSLGGLVCSGPGEQVNALASQPLDYLANSIVTPMVIGPVTTLAVAAWDGRRCSLPDDPDAATTTDVDSFSVLNGSWAADFTPKVNGVYIAVVRYSTITGHTACATLGAATIDPEQEGMFR